MRCCLLPLLSLALALAPECLRAGDRVVCGTVVAVNAQRSQITLRPSNVFGFFRMNLSSYAVKQPILLNGLHSGDRITAVLSTSDGKLHRLRRQRNCPVYNCAVR